MTILYRIKAYSWAILAGLVGVLGIIFKAYSTGKSRQKLAEKAKEAEAQAEQRKKEKLARKKAQEEFNRDVKKIKSREYNFTNSDFDKLHDKDSSRMP